ncbi:MAG: divalent-cation tolerance protein CutA [Rubrivivax sp.]
MNTDPWLVVTTVGSAADARTLARDMVESRFAACAQVSAIDSIYRWQGEVHAGPEWRVLFKTRPDAAPALVAAIRARHPYQLPAIHAIATTLAEPAYAQWVAESVDQQPGGGADTR